MFYKKAGLAALLLSVAITSCASPRIERLAVLPLENLSAESQLDWVGRAAAAAVVYDLEGLAKQYSQTVDSLSNAYAIHATRVLQGYYVERRGQLEIRATVEDVVSKKNIDEIRVAGPASSGMMPLVNELAKRLNAEARPFGTSNGSAFRAYGEALGANDRASALKDLESATEADPKFGAAYVAWARLLAAGGDRAQANRLRVLAIGRGLSAIDRARLTGQLDELTKLTPADASVFQQRAELRLQRRDIRGAVQDFEATTRLNPDDAENWNQLGYAMAFAGNLAGARQALEHYQELLPAGNANGLDSLGEVSFYLGDFAAAANYFEQAQQRNPPQSRGAEFLKAAQAKLMVGDLAGADALFQKYLAAEPGVTQARAGLEQARWEYLTGRRKAGVAGLEKLIPELDADGQSVGLCQLSVWKLESGDAKAAIELAEHGAEAAASPGTRSLSAICKFIANPPAAKSGSATVDAYGLIFTRKFREALPVLQSMYAETNMLRDGQVRTLLAWAYLETGNVTEASRLVTTYPIPFSSAEPPFSSLIFPRYLFLKARALEGEGKRAEAKRMYELFLKYAGDVPDVFGSATAARERLSKL